MQFRFRLLNEADARAIQGWRYAGEYAIYNMSADDPDERDELLDRRSPYYAAHDESGALVGFFVFGTSAEIEDRSPPGMVGEDGTITVGLGLRPDLTGKGLGVSFVNAGLAFAKAQFAPVAFRLFVMPFNERAIRVYERAGFQRVGLVTQRGPRGERAFLEMRRPA